MIDFAIRLWYIAINRERSRAGGIPLLRISRSVSGIHRAVIGIIYGLYFRRVGKGPRRWWLYLYRIPQCSGNSDLLGNPWSRRRRGIFLVSMRVPWYISDRGWHHFSGQRKPFVDTAGRWAVALACRIVDVISRVCFGRLADGWRRSPHRPLARGFFLYFIQPQLYS